MKKYQNRLHDVKNPEDDHYLLRMPTKIPSQKLIERRQRVQLQRKQREDAKEGGEEAEKVVIHLQKQIALKDFKFKTFCEKCAEHIAKEQIKPVIASYYEVIFPQAEKKE